MADFDAEREAKLLVRVTDKRVIASRLSAVYRAGRESMREEAAIEADSFDDLVARAIRALPIGGESE